MPEIARQWNVDTLDAAGEASFEEVLKSEHHALNALGIEAAGSSYSSANPEAHEFHVLDQTPAFLGPSYSDVRILKDCLRIGFMARGAQLDFTNINRLFIIEGALPSAKICLQGLPRIIEELSDSRSENGFHYASFTRKALGQSAFVLGYANVQTGRRVEATIATEALKQRRDLRYPPPPPHLPGLQHGGWL